MDTDLPPSSSSSDSSVIISNPVSESGSTRSRSNSVSPQSSQASVNKPRVKPIILQSTQWRQIAPSVYDIPDITLDNTYAKAAADGKIWLRTDTPQHFRQIQDLLHSNDIAFHSFNLPEDQSLKVVIRGIPVDVSVDEVHSDLENRGFSVKLIKRFGPQNKPMQICLVILSKNKTATDIYNLTSMFFMKVQVESFRKSGPAQCYACQRFGHGSQNCGHPARCVKCAGNHSAKECTKTLDQDPSCVNCGGTHTANFRGCPYYQHVLATSTSGQAKKTIPSTSQAIPDIQEDNHAVIPNSQTQPLHRSFANVVSGKKQPPQNNTLSLTKVLALLKDLLAALTTVDNPKDVMILTINSFLGLISDNA